MSPCIHKHWKVSSPYPYALDKQQLLWSIAQHHEQDIFKISQASSSEKPSWEFDLTNWFYLSNTIACILPPYYLCSCLHPLDYHQNILAKHSTQISSPAFWPFITNIILCGVANILTFMIKSKIGRMFWIIDGVCFSPIKVSESIREMRTLKVIFIGTPWPCLYRSL